MTRKVWLFGAFALIASPALAHHPGGASNAGGAGPIVTISASTPEAGHGAVAFTDEYLAFGGLGDRDLIDAAGKHIHAHSIGTIQSASASPPMASRTTSWCRCASRGRTAPTSAKGTTSIWRAASSATRSTTAAAPRVSATSRCLANGASFNNQATRTEAAVLFGMKLPTGATDRVDRLGELFEAEFQPGSGSLDVLLGAAFTQRYGAWSFRPATGSSPASFTRFDGAAIMTLKSLSLAAAALLVASAAHAHSHKFKKLEIVHPWCIETNDAAKPVAIYMTIRNAGGRPDKLLRATTSMAAKAEPREAGASPEAEGNVITAVAVGGHGEVNLKRAGPHILLSGMKKQLSPYDSFFMTLAFERAGKVEVEVMVEDASVLEPPHK
jgi:copper(I)-binding protein